MESIASGPHAPNEMSAPEEVFLGTGRFDLALVNLSPLY